MEKGELTGAHFRREARDAVNLGGIVYAVSVNSGSVSVSGSPLSVSLFAGLAGLLQQRLRSSSLAAPVISFVVIG